jgi:hypothetical protein
MKQIILIFIKNPVEGNVKTRLAVTVGNAASLSIYQSLLRHTQAITKELHAGKIVFYSDNVEDGDIWDDKIYKKKLQIGNDLGERMKNAFEDTFEEGKNKVILIGSDCLELTPAIINEAFSILQNKDLVVGPATDGGYYLIGMKKLHAPLFQNISWGSGDVLMQTLEAAVKQALTFYLLAELSDLDNEEDLIAMKNKSLYSE